MTSMKNVFQILPDSAASYFEEVEEQAVKGRETQPLSFRLIRMDQKKLLQLLLKIPVYQLREENEITGSKLLHPVQRSTKITKQITVDYKNKSECYLKGFEVQVCSRVSK